MTTGILVNKLITNLKQAGPVDSLLQRHYHQFSIVLILRQNLVNLITQHGGLEGRDKDPLLEMVAKTLLSELKGLIGK